MIHRINASAFADRPSNHMHQLTCTFVSGITEGMIGAEDKEAQKEDWAV